MQFDTLLQAVAPVADDHLVLLGDYVDRGPNSAGVLKAIIALRRTHQLTCLMGNHEQMMLAARDSQSHEKLSDWLRNGGDETLRSYSGVQGTLRDVPEEHWAFLEGALVDYLETDTHLFVHGSAYPDMAMHEQPDYMLRWERFETILPPESGKTIVCGHTPQKSGRPGNKGFAICLDTNACRGGMLTCMDANSGRVWQANSQGQVARAHISDFAEEGL